MFSHYIKSALFKLALFKVLLYWNKQPLLHLGAFNLSFGLQLIRSERTDFTNLTSLRYLQAFSSYHWNTCCKNLFRSVPYHYSHCVFSLLIHFEEDVCTFLIFSYSSIDQQLLLKQFCSNRLSFWDSLLTSTAGAALLGWIGCAG